MCHTMAGAPVDLMMMLFGDYRLYRLTMGGGGGGGVKREGIINNKLEKLEWRSTSLLCNLLTRSSVTMHRHYRDRHCRCHAMINE